MTSEEFIHDRLCKVAEDFEARHREFADAAKVTEEHDIARGQVAIGAAYRKCAEAVRNAIRELASVPVDEDAPGSEPKTAVTIAFVDLRCGHAYHADKGVYRMVGKCRNCTSEVLGLHTVGHAADHGISGPDCPVCGINAIGWHRLATPDEIPADYEQHRTTVQDVADDIASWGDHVVDLDDDGERDTARRMDALDEAARLEAGL